MYTGISVKKTLLFKSFTNTAVEEKNNPSLRQKMVNTKNISIYKTKNTLLYLNTLLFIIQF